MSGRGEWSGKLAGRLRPVVLAEYGSVCWLCGGVINLDAGRFAPDSFSIDHILPRSKGGSNDLANLRPAHRSCNTRRQAKPPGKPRRKIIDTGFPGIK